MFQNFDRYPKNQRPSWGGLIRLLSWRGILLLTVSAAMAIAIFVAAASVFLLVLPIALVVGLVARMLIGGTGSPARTEPWRRAHDDNLIEGNYEVVEARADRRNPTSSNRP